MCHPEEQSDEGSSRRRMSIISNLSIELRFARFFANAQNDAVLF